MGILTIADKLELKLQSEELKKHKLENFLSSASIEDIKKYFVEVNNGKYPDDFNKIYSSYLDKKGFFSDVFNGKDEILSNLWFAIATAIYSGRKELINTFRVIDVDNFFEVWDIDISYPTYINFWKKDCLDDTCLNPILENDITINNILEISRLVKNYSDLSKQTKTFIITEKKEVKDTLIFSVDFKKVKNKSFLNEHLTEYIKDNAINMSVEFIQNNT
ncbi:hypothetical protein QJU11_09905 [Pasteurella atlantica]|uniref:hypothetical protein n=1 Tax=Phocoenobacter atlanticus TaxID=3416742 RepID=UPI002743CF38|nr:hypothetical protein [Pasteurella atlantica]MDP8042504.1 hypothetical protein [Pasteurella atlantica]